MRRRALLGLLLALGGGPSIADAQTTKQYRIAYLTGYSDEVDKPLFAAFKRMAYGTSFEDLYRRSARFVDRIFKGARPGDLPIEQPTKFDLLINLKVAKAIGVNVPRSVLLRADQVIE